MFEGIEKLESEDWTRRKKVVINCVKQLSKGGLNRFLVQSGMSCEFVMWHIAWGRKGKTCLITQRNLPHWLVSCTTHNGPCYAWKLAKEKSRTREKRQEQNYNFSVFPLEAYQYVLFKRKLLKLQFYPCLFSCNFFLVGFHV